MLAGEPPFDAAMPMELAWAHQERAGPDVRVLRADVPAPVVATIATATASIRDSDSPPLMRCAVP